MTQKQPTHIELQLEQSTIQHSEYITAKLRDLRRGEERETNLVGLAGGDDADVGAPLAHALAAGNVGAGELDTAVNAGVQRVVLAHVDVEAGVVLGTTLADDDVAHSHLLVAEALDTEVATGGVGLVDDDTTGLLGGRADKVQRGRERGRRGEGRARGEGSGRGEKGHARLGEHAEAGAADRGKHFATKEGKRGEQRLGHDQ